MCIRDRVMRQVLPSERTGFLYDFRPIRFGSQDLNVRFLCKEVDLLEIAQDKVKTGSQDSTCLLYTSGSGSGLRRRQRCNFRQGRDPQNRRGRGNRRRNDSNDTGGELFQQGMKTLIENSITWARLSGHPKENYTFSIERAVLGRQDNILTIRIRLNFVVPFSDVEKIEAICKSEVEGLSGVRLEFIYEDVILTPKAVSYTHLCEQRAKRTGGKQR